VLEGSVRKSGTRVRITGQLIDATTGAHMWAEKIDGAIEDVFDLQDEVTAQVVGAIEPSITKAEISRAIVKPTVSLDAYDVYLRALSAQYSQTQSDTRAALELLDQAIAIDPSYSWAKAFAAYIHCLRISQGWNSPEDRAKADQFARDALVSHGDNPQTLAYAAHATAWLAREFDIALAALDRAVQSNPYSFDILARSGWVRAWVGQFEQAIDHFMRSVRVNPRDPQLGYAYGGLAFVYIMQSEYDKALEFARRTAHDMPTWTYGWNALAAACAYTGRMDEAADAIRHLQRLSPGFTASIYRRNGTARDRWLTEKMSNGLILAGLPE
jgi:adenylate cyclase